MYDEIVKASETIRKYIRNVPLHYSYIFSELFNSKIYFKLENLQRTGSFKIRGALYSILKNTNKISTGVITASAGNHAQGVAFGCKISGLNALIVMPVSTPLIKIENTRTYGADILLHGQNYDEAYEKAQTIAKEKGLFFIHPFDDTDVMAGQGTIAPEIMNELSQIDYIVVPIGGGGLASGISSYVKKNNPKIKIIGVQAANSASMYYSFKRGNIVTIPSSNTIADGIAVHKISTSTFNICKNNLDDIIIVSENEIAHATLALMEKSKLIVEGAGAVALAAILSNKLEIKNKTGVLIISGGNIDVNLISRIINKGLTTTGRFLQINIKLTDTPGSLAAVTQTVANLGANILDIKHHRFNTYTEIGYTKVTFDLETKGFKHIKEIINTINKSGYEVACNE